MIFGAAAELIICFMLLGVWWAGQRGGGAPRTLFSEAKLSQVPFQALYPTPDQSLEASDQGFHYYDSEKLVVIEALLTDIDVRVVLSQQQLPQELKDSNEKYEELLSTMHQYASLSTKYGKVALARPTDQGGQQTAVMVAGATLIFIRANEDLTEDQWRIFINGLQLE